MSIHVQNTVPVKRLDGDSYFRKKPVVEIVSAPDQWNEKRVTLRVKVGVLDVKIDVSPADLRKAIDNALNT